ncbi:hypothetical protein [Streptomyces zaomyceticus]|uniref:hypothetical protein n=1 Tax=Streptomyces zaomyceticus TaxID=68286 RepID=UPI0033B37DA4
MSDDYAEAAAYFKRATAGHEMTVLHEDGLYRHLRFQTPGNGSSYGYDLIIWPYNLVIRGGWTFTFTIDATEDMFDLFRRTSFPGEINPSYWQEKVTAGRDEIEDFDDSLFEQQVKQHVVDAIRNGDAPRGIGAEVTRDIFEWGDISHEAGARQELENFRFEGWSFGETWEWNFRSFTPGFLWSCHAIRHGIELYAAARKTEAVAA